MLNAAQVATMLGISRRAVYDLARSGGHAALKATMSHIPQDAARRLVDKLGAAAPHPPIAQPDVLRAAAEKARAALSDLLLKRDPIVYSDALRALDEALAQAPIAQPQAAADPAQQLPHAYLLEKLRRVMPMLQEARDALTAITEAQRKVHGISASLADRMDAAGTYSLDDWQREQPLPEPPKEGV